jgi:hypothetical protein
LQLIERLQSLLGRELGTDAARLHALRLRSKDRFGEGYLPFMTRKGLEQASARDVGNARAARVAEVSPDSWIWDATSGIGADVLSFQSRGIATCYSDLDLESVTFARANSLYHGFPDRAACAAASEPPFRGPDLVFLDPDRRPGGRRTLDPRAWSPTLEESLDIVTRFRGGCVKLPPAFEPASLAVSGRPYRLQWVSRRRELAEVCLWAGVLARGDPDERELLAIDGNGEAQRLAARPRPVAALDEADAARIQWLAEPDPAVIRAGLLGNVAECAGLRPLAPRLAYLGGAQRPASPLLRAWRVLGSVALDRRRVRALLGEHDVGPLTVKKRGHPDSAEALARRLRGPGRRPGLLAVGRLERGHRAWLLDEASEVR